MKYAFPIHYCKWERDGWYIYYDPNNFTWLKVNRDGKDILELLKNSGDTQEVIKELAIIHNESVSTITELVEKFVSNSFKVGFLHQDVYRKLNIENILPEYPHSLYLTVSNRCGLSCIYCYNQQDRAEFGDSYEMSYDEYCIILNEASDLGVKKIVFTGGEPLLYPNIIQLAKKAKELGMMTELLTNGILVDETNYIEIASAFDNITVSFDSHIKEIQELQRGIGTYKIVLNALRLLNDVKPNNIYVTAVISKHNIKLMVDFYRFMKEKFDIDKIITHFCLPFDRPTAETNEDLMPSFEDIEKMDKDVAEYLFSRNYGNLNEGKSPLLLRRATCGAGVGELGIAPNGDVFPCHTLHKKEFFCGNLRSQSLKKICRASKILQYFKNLTSERIEKCASCDVRLICGGGCRALAYTVSGRIDGHNPLLCEYLRDQAIKQLWEASAIPFSQLNKKKTKIGIETCL